MSFICKACGETPIHCFCCPDELCGPIHDCPDCQADRAQDHADELAEQAWRGCEK